MLITQIRCCITNVGTSEHISVAKLIQNFYTRYVPLHPLINCNNTKNQNMFGSKLERITGIYLAFISKYRNTGAVILEAGAPLHPPSSPLVNEGFFHPRRLLRTNMQLSLLSKLNPLLPYYDNVS